MDHTRAWRYVSYKQQELRSQMVQGTHAHKVVVVLGKCSCSTLVALMFLALTLISNPENVPFVTVTIGLLDTSLLPKANAMTRRR